MIVATVASGSGGNCTAIYNEDTALLLDAGVSCRRIVEGLRELALSPERLSGILITHGHSDHIRALRLLTAKYHLPVYATRDTCADILRQEPTVSGSLQPFVPGELLHFGSMTVQAYPTSHDAPGSVCYRIESEGKAFALATDIGKLTKSVLSAVLHADTVIVEANHDREMLLSGPYPAYLKHRILSDFGHLSNEECGKLCSYLAGEGTKRVILAHLSKKNNTPDTAFRAVWQKLQESGQACEVTVASPDVCCGPWEV